MTESYRFDETDLAIVGLLKANGRVTNRDIARQLNITRATVGSRIAKMTEAGALRIVAAVDFSAYGYDVLLAIAVKVSGRAVSEVAADFAALDEVFAVHAVTGAHHLEVLVAAHDFGELATTVVAKLASIRGIGEIDVAIVTDMVKYRFDVGIPR